MPYYVASYDYHQHRDYTRIYELMDRLGAVRLLLSTWLVAVNATAPNLRDGMIACGDGDESFAVLELTPNSDWATIGVPAAAVDWLSDNIATKE